MSINKNQQFPWRKENAFNLMKNGSVFYPKMLKAIDNAQSLILLETYFVESGEITSQFVMSLITAAKRGVKVFVLFDAMGSRNLNDSDRSLLEDNAVNLCFYRPLKFKFLLDNFYRDHRKLLLIDDSIAFVGGAGLSDRFIGEDYWRDNMVEIKGSVVLDWHQLFLGTWKKHSKSSIPAYNMTQSLNPQFKALGRVAYSRGYFLNDIKKNLMKNIKKSKSRVWLASAYFVPSLKLRRTLYNAASQNIDVKLLVPGIKTDNPMSRYIGQGYYNKLLKKGVKIYEYNQHFIHSKVVLVDEWITIGSSNLDRWGAKWNLEANQEINDKTFSKCIYDMFIADLENTTEITLEIWKKRAISQKIRIWFWKYMARIIARIGLNGKK